MHFGKRFCTPMCPWARHVTLNCLWRLFQQWDRRRAVNSSAMWMSLDRTRKDLNKYSPFCIYQCSVRITCWTPLCSELQSGIEHQLSELLKFDTAWGFLGSAGERFGNNTIRPEEQITQPHTPTRPHLTHTEHILSQLVCMHNWLKCSLEDVVLLILCRGKHLW